MKQGVEVDLAADGQSPPSRGARIETLTPA